MRKKNKQRIKKGIFIGLGLTALATKKVENTIKHIIKKNKININKNKAKLLAKKVVNKIRQDKKLKKKIIALEKKIIKHAIVEGKSIAKSALNAGIKNLKKMRQNKIKRRKKRKR